MLLSVAAPRGVDCAKFRSGMHPCGRFSTASGKLGGMVLVLTLWGVGLVLIAVIVLVAAHLQSLKEDAPRKSSDPASNPSRTPRVAGANIAFAPTSVGDPGESDVDDGNPVFLGQTSSVVEVHNFRNGTKQKAREARGHQGQ